MANVMPAVAALVLTRQFKVAREQQALCTAVAALTNGPLALAPAFIAAGAAREGKGHGLFQRGRHNRPRETFEPVTPAPGPTPDASPPWTQVPSVIGKSRADAISTLQDAKFKVGVREVPVLGQTSEVVIEQTHAEEWKPQGAQINLTIARPPVQQAPPTADDELAEVKLVQSEVEGVKGDVASVKGDVASVKGDVASVRNDVASLKNDLNGQFEKVMKAIQQGPSGQPAETSAKK